MFLNQNFNDNRGAFMQRIKYKNKRFTLVEVMVSLAILVIMMGFLFEFVIGAQKVWSANKRMSKLFSKAQIAFQWMEYDLKNAVYQSDVECPRKLIPFYLPNDLGSESIFMVVADEPVNSTGQYFTSLLYSIKDESSISTGSVNKLKILYRKELPLYEYMEKSLTEISSLVTSSSFGQNEVLIDGIVKIDIKQASSALKIEVTLCDYDKVLQLNKDNATDPVIKTAVEDTSRTFSKIIFLNSALQEE